MTRGRGLFVTLEGGEGAGKSTVMAGLEQRLRAAGHAVVTTREPGGTPVGEALRTLLLDPRTGELSAATEALLFCAARAEHVRLVLRPALSDSAVVLCDRFTDSTLAYQGYGRGLDLRLLREVDQMSTGGLSPELTILFDVPATIGLARRHGQGLMDRIDAEDIAFHDRVRDGFLDLAKAAPGRWQVLDATAGASAVEEAAWAAVAERLGERVPSG